MLAAAGIGSRRACEELITSGRVEVDRVVVSVLGTRVDPVRQEIRVDGERLPDPRRSVHVVYKPVGVVTTNFDPAGRPRVVDLVPGEQRLFAVGRLDRMSEGLILVTNDGELANLLAHPRYGVEKRYLVQVAGVPTPETLDKLRRGVGLAEGTARAQHVFLRSQHKLSAVLEMVLDEGKNREIRRMLAQLGHKVHQLKRIAVGNVTLGDLLPGQSRRLSAAEVESLRRDALAHAGPADEGDFARRPPRGRGRPPMAGGRPPRRSMDQGRGRPAGRPPAGRPAGRPATGTPAVGRPDAGPRPGARPPIDDRRPRRPAGSPAQQPGGAVAPRGPVPGVGRRRRPGKASAWRKPRGE
ncbi:MAG: pseudouridine synthase [Planctomycetia bacterium]|nr:pseudouridine synthase [Planctomycetia bacterium]